MEKLLRNFLCLKILQEWSTMKDEMIPRLTPLPGKVYGLGVHERVLRFASNNFAKQSDGKGVLVGGCWSNVEPLALAPPLL